MGEDTEFEGIDVDAEDLKDRLMEKREMLSWKLSRKRRIGVLTAFVLAVAVVGFYTFGTDALNSSLGEVSSGESYQAPEIEGEIQEIAVTDEDATPTSPTIAPEDGIRIVNEASHELEFEFDREVETFTLEPGESRTLDLTRIVYYSADTVDESVEFRKIKARVNVQ